MLEAVLKLLEKLIKLGEVREANRQRYVDRYATPVYLAAEIIYRDYSSLLRDLRRRIRTGRRTLPLIRFVEQRRLDQLPSRIKIRAIMRRTPEGNWTRFEQGVLGLINGCLSDSDTYQSIHPIRRASPGPTRYTTSFVASSIKTARNWHRYVLTFSRQSSIRSLASTRHGNVFATGTRTCKALRFLQCRSLNRMYTNGLVTDRERPNSAAQTATTAEHARKGHPT